MRNGNWVVVEKMKIETICSGCHGVLPVKRYNFRWGAWCEGCKLWFHVSPWNGKIIMQVKGV